MYQITAKGSETAVNQAWDALAWADPSPAGAVDAKEDGRRAWRLDAFAESREDADACMDLIRETAPELNPVMEALEDRDWVTLSLEGLPPVTAGRFIVAGSHALARSAPGKTSILIEAGPAFGTGHHGTTLGCLLGLEFAIARGSITKTLDVGTGSGVLAIAALKSGARRAICTDVDAESIRITRENGVKNHVGAGLTAITVTGCNHPLVRRDAPYDLVFANILMRPLIALADDLIKSCRRGGTVVLSGLLREQEPLVRAAYTGRNMVLAKRIHRDGWSTLVLTKPR